MSNLIRVVGFRATGTVRGPCDHRHGTAALAQRCADADAKRCAKRGLFSDRRVVPALSGDVLLIDGEEHWLVTAADRYADSALAHLGAMPARGDHLMVVHGRWAIGWQVPQRRARPPHPDQTNLDEAFETVDFMRDAAERYFGVER